YSFTLRLFYSSTLAERVSVLAHRSRPPPARKKKAKVRWALSPFTFPPQRRDSFSPRSGSDSRRVIFQKVARAAGGVVRIGDLSARRAGWAAKLRGDRGSAIAAVRPR